MPDKNVIAVILAAGRSTRMGEENKLLKHWRGNSLLVHVCAAADKSICGKTIVVTGHQRRKVEEAIKEFDVQTSHNPDYQSGLASSLKTGIIAARKHRADAVLVLLADMPKITHNIINKLISGANEHSPDKIMVAKSHGKRGNPLIWPKIYFDELLNLSGDQGARQIFSRHKDNIVELELDEGVLFDLDTPEAFQSNAE